VVGKTGCGKSTIVNLLLRFYEVSKGDGAILLDGTDIRELDVHWLRDQIAIVMQNPLLFSSSIADNISYGTLSPPPNQQKIIFLSYMLK